MFHDGASQKETNEWFFHPSRDSGETDVFALFRGKLNKHKKMLNEHLLMNTTTKKKLIFRDATFVW